MVQNSGPQRKARFCCIACQVMVRNLVLILSTQASVAFIAWQVIVQTVVLSLSPEQVCIHRLPGDGAELGLVATSSRVFHIRHPVKLVVKCHAINLCNAQFRTASESRTLANTTEIRGVSGSWGRNHSRSRLQGIMTHTSNVHQVNHRFLIKGPGATTLSCVSTTFSTTAVARSSGLSPEGIFFGLLCYCSSCLSDVTDKHKQAQASLSARCDTAAAACQISQTSTTWH
jgi:hypothetical protein